MMSNAKLKINQEAKVGLTNFEKHIQKEMKNKEFREAFKKEGVRLQVAYAINKIKNT